MRSTSFVLPCMILAFMATSVKLYNFDPVCLTPTLMSDFDLTSYEGVWYETDIIACLTGYKMINCNVHNIVSSDSGVVTLNFTGQLFGF